MKKSIILTIIGLLLLSLAFTSTLAQDDTVNQQGEKPVGDTKTEEAAEDAEPEIEIEEPLPSSQDVVTAFVFPQSFARKFKLGNPIELVLGFKNKGNKFFNVTQVAAELVWPQDFSVYVQNFTRRQVSQLVRPAEEVSFGYVFTPDPGLEPRDFGVVASILYHDESLTNYSTTFVNTTILLEEPESTFDARTFFTYVLFTALAALGGFFGYQALTKSGKKKSAKVAIERGTVASTSEPENDWLSGTAADPTRTNSPGYGKGGRKKHSQQ